MQLPIKAGIRKRRGGERREREGGNLYVNKMIKIGRSRMTLPTFTSVGHPFSLATLPRREMGLDKSGVKGPFTRGSS